ncbi:hypothetical protein BGZ47_008973 [Haplosporangium gracile]|nr:hypothetical protein BGZ47_008973 [Haplosporangium gracile]
MSSFLSSLEYCSSSSTTDIPSSTSITTTATATDHTTTSSHPSLQQQKPQEQHTPTPAHIINNNNNSIEGESDQSQQSWKSDSFVELLDLFSSDPVGAQTITSFTATNGNNAIASSNNIHLWTALDGGNGSDWESEQLRSLLNLSDQDMDLFQDGVHHGLVGANDGSSSVGPLRQQALPVGDGPSAAVGQMMHQHGSLNAQHQYQQQLLLHQQQQQQQQQRHRQSSFDSTTPITLRHQSKTPLTNPRQTPYMTSSIPPPALSPLSAAAEIKRPGTKESFIHPGFYSLPHPSPQYQRSSSQQQQWPQQQETLVKMGIKRSFQEDDSCPITTTSTTTSLLSSSSSSSSHRHHHHHGAMMKDMDLRRHSVDGYHVAAKAAAAAATTARSMGGSVSPAPPHAGVYSTPPKTPNNVPTSMFHAHGHPHARASTVDYSQVPPGQPFMATNASPLMSHYQYNANRTGGSSPGSSPFQPTAHFVRSLSSPAGTRLATTASAFSSSPTPSTTSSSGSNSNSGTPKKRRASKFRTDSTLSHATGTAGMIPFDPTALLSHFGLVNTLPPPLQQQHPHTQSLGFQHHQPQSEHAVLFQQQQQQQLQAAIRRQQQQQQQQHQQFVAAAAAAIGATGGSRSGSNSIAGQQNAHASLMQHLVSDPRLAAATAAAASLAGATPLTSTKMQVQQGQQHSTIATMYRRNPGEVPSSTLPPDHFIFQEASLLNRYRQQAAQQHHAQQQQQAKQAQQAKQQAQQQGGGRARSNSVVPTTTAGVQVGSTASGSGGKAAASRRCSEPVNLYQQHQQQQQLRLLQAQQAQQYQHQQLHLKSQSEQDRSIKDHQLRSHHHHHQQYHHQQQQQHLAMVVKANSLYASPISTSSSSSPASSSTACESAIPCGHIITPEMTAATAAEDVTVADVNDAGKKPRQSEVEFNMSSIATATEAVEASSTITIPVIEQKPYQGTKVATVNTNTDSEMPLAVTTTGADDTFESESAQADIKSVEEKPEQQVAEEGIKQEAVKEKDEDEEEKKKEEPLSAAETFAKSLTAVTTTLDPAATQLMDQLRLQEYLRVSVSTSLPTGTPTITILGDSRSK